MSSSDVHWNLRKQDRLPNDSILILQDILIPDTKYMSENNQGYTAESDQNKSILSERNIAKEFLLVLCQYYGDKENRKGHSQSNSTNGYSEVEFHDTKESGLREYMSDKIAPSRLSCFRSNG